MHATSSVRNAQYANFHLSFVISIFFFIFASSFSSPKPEAKTGKGEGKDDILKEKALY